jgi:hypothetical protein
MCSYTTPGINPSIPKRKPIRPAPATALDPVNLAKACGLESKREGRPK